MYCQRTTLKLKNTAGLSYDIYIDKRNMFIRVHLKLLKMEFTARDQENYSIFFKKLKENLMVDIRYLLSDLRRDEMAEEH